MRIVLPLHDLLDELFPEAATYRNDPEKLKAQLRKYYSWGPVEPTVTLDGEFAIIDVDTVAVEQFEDDYNRTATLAQKGQYEQAETLLRRLIEEYPTASDLYRMYGQARYEQGQADEAQDYLIDAL